MVAIPILYENEQVMVVNKPCWVVVNRAEAVSGETIQDWAEERNTKLELRITNDEMSQAFWKRSGIAHRLDKETSGCLLMAKNPEALSELLRQFKNREVKKTYLALVHGLVEPSEGVWRLPIGRVGESKHLFKVQARGKQAETAYSLQQVFEQGDRRLSLLKVYPKTGRTHQIRVHMAHLKHPLVADDKYGGKRAKADSSWCPRLFLHAQAIGFRDPATQRQVLVEAPLPADLMKVMEEIQAYGL